MDKDKQNDYFTKKYAGAVFLWSLILFVSVLGAWAAVLSFSNRLSQHELSQLYIMIGGMCLFFVMSIVGLIYCYRQVKKDNLPTSLFWNKVCTTIFGMFFVVLISLIAAYFPLR